jgi:bacteriorhodopsin
MTVSYLIGALVPSTYKWGFFTFAVSSLFYIWYHVIFPSGSSASFLGSNVGKGFRIHAIGLMFIWGLYPICWGLSEGGNVISPTGEMVFYGVLDLISKPLFLFAYIWQVGTVDYGVWGFQSGKASEFGTARPISSESKERMRSEDQPRSEVHA